MSTKRIVPTSAPFTPRKVITSSGVSNSRGKTSSTLTEAPSVEVTKLTVKKIVDTPTASKKISSPDSVLPTLQSEDFPALGSAKKNVVSTNPTSKIAVPVSLVINSKKSASSPIPTLQTTSKLEENHSIPTLSISVPAKNSTKAPTPPENPKQPAAQSSMPTSTTSSVNSPLSRNSAKTLRLFSTPKTEASTGGTATPSSISSVFPPQISKIRQPFFTANARLDRPGSPTSEIISDNASITSTSFSRASSPPPTRVGSAPIRVTTKSSQKKQRLAQKEKGRAEIEAAAVIATEVEIAPIIGRKKKQKKGRSPSAMGAPTPITSKLNSSVSSTSFDESGKNLQTIEGKSEVDAKKMKAEPDPPKSSSKPIYSKTNGESKEKVTNEFEPKSTCSEEQSEPTEKPPATPAAIFQELVASGLIRAASELFLLKNISSSNRHPDLPEKPENVEISPKLTITPEDHDLLLDGKTVHKIAEGGYRIMLTPNGDCVRNLTEEEEKRYLEYQEHLAKDFGPTTFVSAKHSGQNGFTMIGGRAVPSGPPTFFPVHNKGSSSLDPVSKIQRDEALNYINQYVLPTLSSNTQLDKTLNANALQGEMMRSNSVDATWKTWSPDQVSNTAATSDFYMSPSPNGESMIDNIATHFPIGDMSRQRSGSLLSLTDAESAMQVARKEVEGLEKRLNSLIKKNRRLLLGTGH